MIRLSGAIVSLLICTAVQVLAQPYTPDQNSVFRDDVLPTVYIEIDPSSLATILTDVYSDRQFPARFIWESGGERDTVENIGFGLRGNTSREAVKKSFKISFNTYEQGQKFKGLEKLNLNGEHNDPSVIRAKLAWDVFGQMTVPASRANHVRMVINGTYYGLYINVEHVDEQFLQTRFANATGNLYKCLWPADLVYKSGGAGAYRPTNDERRPYDLTQGVSDEEGYGDLAHFIDVLNNTPDAAFKSAIEQIFEVNGYLRVMAADAVFGNWDNYWFLKNNFYLYHNPETGRFHFIPYDVDNTFGIDFVQEDWGNRNVYAWGSNNEPRPLAVRILNVPEYRERYTFYIRQLLEGPARLETLQPRIETLHDLITPAIESDVYYPQQYQWNVSDFHRSYEESLGGHVEYGLEEFIQTRSQSALAQLDPVNVHPILSELRVKPDRPGNNQDIQVNILVEDEATPASVQVAHHLEGTADILVDLFDDGQHSDGVAGDGYYGGRIPALKTDGRVLYRILATDASGQISETKTNIIRVGTSSLEVYINELMSSNSSTIDDETGQSEDWIELYNGSDAPVSLAGFTLTDNFDYPAKWSLPDVSIPARGFLIVWADNDLDQGPLHASFSLDKAGEQIGLYDPSGTAVSTFSFGALDTDQAYGRVVDGGVDLATLNRATPGASNGTEPTGTDDLPVVDAPFSFLVYPNPVQQEASIRIETPAGVLAVEVWDVMGRRVRRLMDRPVSPGIHLIRWNGTNDQGLEAPSGTYFIRANTTSPSGTRRTVTQSIVLVR